LEHVPPLLALHKKTMKKKKKSAVVESAS